MTGSFIHKIAPPGYRLYVLAFLIIVAVCVMSIFLAEIREYFRDIILGIFGATTGREVVNKTKDLAIERKQIEADAQSKSKGMTDNEIADYINSNVMD